MSDIKTTELRLTGPELRSALVQVYPHWRELFNVANAWEGFDTASRQNDQDAMYRWQADFDEAMNEACAQIDTLVISVGES